MDDYNYIITFLNDYDIFKIDKKLEELLKTLSNKIITKYPLLENARWNINVNNEKHYKEYINLINNSHK